jgi:outer membrane cobalamin receptor
MRLPSARPFSWLLLVLLVCSVRSVAAAGSITGRIVDPDGRPIVDARVLVARDGVIVQSATSNERGQFTIPVATGEGLTLRLAAEGFRSDPIEVNGSGDARDVGTITMRISALAESVVVSASHVEIPLSQVTSSVTVIGGAEIETRQLHSVADALRVVPGMTIVRTGGIGANTGIFPRGGESNFTLALVDGMPVNAFGGDVDLGQLSTANIDRIEIVRGPQSALFGSNAIGSVVRIVPRRGGPPSVQFALEGSENSTSRLTTSTAGTHGDFEWGGMFDQLLSDGMNGELTSAGAVIANDDYERRSGSLSAGWRRSTSWIRANLQHAADDRGFPGPFGSNPIDAYEGIDVVSRGSNDRTVGSVSLGTSVTARTRVHGHAGYNRIDSDFASPFGGSESYSKRWSGRAQADITAWSGLDVSAGFEVQRERTGSTFITGASAQQIPIARTIAGYFGEARWQSRDRLFVTAGVRVEDINRDRIEEAPSTFSPRPVLPSDRVLSTNPRVAAAWMARPGTSTYTKVRGGLGTGIRPPDGFELAFTDNPELRPERSVSGEIGIDQGFAGGHGLIEATTFFNDYDDLIVAVGSFRGSSRYRTDNISNARARGLEFAVTLRGRVSRWRTIDVSGRFGYTFLDTEILAVDQDSAAPPPFSVGQPLLRRPRHQFFADLSLVVSRVNVFLRGSGRNTVLDVEPSLGTFGGLFDAAGYQVWQAGAAWRITRFAEVFGRIENLFDRSYEEAFGFPALGRRATAGFRIAAGR